MKTKRYLAVGDVHGCVKSLKLLLEWVQPTKEDTVVMLGDYVDRGPESRKVLKYLMKWKWEAELVMLKGNHELIMEHAGDSKTNLEYWKEVGGDETLKSYGGTLSKVPEKHWDFLEGLEYFYETENYIFVHGGVHPGRPLMDQDQEEMSWLRFRDQKAHRSGKVIVCGHTVQRKGLPNDLGFGICIDTGVCRGGFLTCLDPCKGKFWQVNEAGDHRMGKLPRKWRKMRAK